MERMCVRVKEACEPLSIGRTSLYKADIPHIKINGVRLYKLDDLRAYLNAHTVKSSCKAGGTL